MLAFVIKRLLWAVMLAVLITFVTFLVFFVIPGETRTGPGQHGLIEPSLQAQFNLHGPLPLQYLAFLERVILHGDLGLSRITGLPATQMITQGLPVTASLVIGGTIFFLLLAVPIGLLSALRPRSLVDKGLMIFVLVGVSAHPLWLGLMLSYVFGVKLHLFPVAGYCDFVRPGPTDLCGGPRFWAYHLILPWITFALLFAALYARMIRASVLEALEEDYVRTARAKGATTRRVLTRHVFRNAALPVVSMLGMDVGVAFAGSLFIETVFQLPGMGTMLFRSLNAGDLPVIMGIVLAVSLAVAAANLIADLVSCLLDPRIRGGTRLRPRGLEVRRRLETSAPRLLRSASAAVRR
jgi:peptide/nickel transport system permease protein